jgi:hypothetical protein
VRGECIGNSSQVRDHNRMSACDLEKGEMQLYLPASPQGSWQPIYCAGSLYRHTNRVEIRQRKGILTGDSGREDNEGKGEMVVNESRLR